MLDLKNAEYLRHDGYMLLKVTIDGIDAIYCDWKPTLYHAGFCSLPQDLKLSDKAETYRYVEDGVENSISGVTSDRRLFLLFDTFLKDMHEGKAEVGPVSIPND